MRDGRVAGLAQVADEGPVLDANRREAEALGGAAVGADRIAREAGQLLHGLLGPGIGHGRGGEGWDGMGGGGIGARGSDPLVRCSAVRGRCRV